MLEWAWSDAPFGFVNLTGRTGSIAIHGLALCQYGGDQVIYRFACNSEWETEQDARYASADEAKARLPEQYRRVPAAWLTP